MVGTLWHKVSLGSGSALNFVSPFKLLEYSEVQTHDGSYRAYQNDRAGTRRSLTSLGEAIGVRRGYYSWTPLTVFACSSTSRYLRQYLKTTYPVTTHRPVKTQTWNVRDLEQMVVVFVSNCSSAAALSLRTTENFNAMQALNKPACSHSKAA